MNSELTIFYSCGHEAYDPEYHPERVRMQRTLDSYCDSCQRDEHRDAVQDYSTQLEECGDEEWEVHRRAFTTLINDIEAENPTWTSEEVGFEAERQAVEAFKAKQPCGIPQIVTTPPDESADYRGQDYSLGYDFDGNLHPQSAFSISNNDLEEQQNVDQEPEPVPILARLITNFFVLKEQQPQNDNQKPEPEPDDFDFDLEDSEDSEDGGAQVMPLENHHRSWDEEPSLG